MKKLKVPNTREFWIIPETNDDIEFVYYQSKKRDLNYLLFAIFLFCVGLLIGAIALLPCSGG